MGNVADQFDQYGHGGISSIRGWGGPDRGRPGWRLDGNVARRGPRLARYGATLPEEVSSLKKFSDTRVAVPFGAATFFVTVDEKSQALPTASPSAGQIPSFPAMLLSGALRAEFHFGDAMGLAKAS